MKAAEALPGIIGGIISWNLNRAADLVGWVSQNLWALVVGIGGFTLYVYGNQKVIILCIIIQFNSQSNTRLLQFQSRSK